MTATLDEQLPALPSRRGSSAPSLCARAAERIRTDPRLADVPAAGELAALLQTAALSLITPADTLKGRLAATAMRARVVDLAAALLNEHPAGR